MRARSAATFAEAPRTVAEPSARAHGLLCRLDRPVNGVTAMRGAVPTSVCGHGMTAAMLPTRDRGCGYEQHKQT